MAKESQDKSAAELRSNYWAFIIYPGDSAPDDWLLVLKSWNVPLFISPLHVPDDEDKKPHRHVMTMFGSVKSLKQVKDISDSVHGTQPFIIQDKAGYGKYLTHRANPEKQQWTEEQLQADPVIGLCGLDYATFLLDAEDPFLVLQEIEDWIEEQDIFSLWEVMRFARQNNSLWYRVLHKRTMAIDIYCKSRLWTKTKQDEALQMYRQAVATREAIEKARNNPDLIEEG